MSAARVTLASLISFTLGVTLNSWATTCHSCADRDPPPPTPEPKPPPPPTPPQPTPPEPPKQAKRRRYAPDQPLSCDPKALQAEDRWPSGQAQQAARLFNVRRTDQASFIQACQQEAQRWQSGHRKGAADAVPIAGGGGCIEATSGIEGTTRPDVFVIRTIVSPPHKKRRKVFVDAGAGKFAQLWPLRSAPGGREWRLGSVAQFVCGYPNGPAFDLHAFEPQWSKYAGLKYERMAGVSDVLQGPMYVGYPAAVKVQWKGVSVSDGEMILAGWGHGARFVDGDVGQQVASEQRRGRKGKVRRLSVVGLSDWLQNNTGADDYVVLKLDVEGMEHRIIPHLVETGAWSRVSELFIECHDPQTGVGNVDMKPRFPACAALRQRVIAELQTPFHDWP